MVSDDTGDFCVVVDFRQDPLTNRCMLFHLATFLKRERSRLLKESRGAPNLSNVVYQPAEMDERLVFFRKPHAGGYISGVDRNGCRMATGVALTRVQGSYQTSGERKVRTLH